MEEEAIEALQRFNFSFGFYQLRVMMPLLRFWSKVLSTIFFLLLLFVQNKNGTKVIVKFLYRPFLSFGLFYVEIMGQRPNYKKGKYKRA